MQFRRQPNHDQRHAIGVARDVQARLAGTEYADDPRWLSAALLHDIGKLDSRLGVYGRVVATVSGAAAGREHAEAWSESSGFTRRVGLYLRHAELGADRIRIAGEPEEAALWSAAHHDPGSWADAADPGAGDRRARRRRQRLTPSLVRRPDTPAPVRSVQNSPRRSA